MSTAPPLLLIGFLGLLGIGWGAGALATPFAFAALLVFATGLAFAGFLWWLAARSFALLRDPATTPDQMAALRDLPMALPEGTVRAVLALIVGVVGLPILLFSQALALNDAVAGYVNGIIAGVFGYYFGARSTAPEAVAARRAQDALLAEQARHEATRQAAAANPDALLGRLEAQARAARLLLERLGPVLPPGMIPASAQGALDAAEGLLRLGRAADPAALTRAIEALAGDAGPLPALLRAAAPLLPAVAGGPVAAVAALLSAGYGLGAEAWRRFRARLLDAPHDPRLFEPGAITPASTELRLAEAPILRRVLGAQLAEAGAMARLLDDALREDAAERLWTRWPGFASPGEAAEGLAEFRRALLRGQVEEDLSARGISLAFPGRGAPEAEAAMQALALLLGEMRQAHLDPAPVLAGMRA